MKPIFIPKFNNRLGRLQKIERESVESEVMEGNSNSSKSTKKSKKQSIIGGTSGRNSDQPSKKGGGPTEAEQALIAEVLRMVEGLRQSTLNNVPSKYRQEVVEENTRTDSSTGGNE